MACFWLCVARPNGLTRSQELCSLCAGSLEEHRPWTQAVWSQLVVGPPGIPRLGPILAVIYDCLGDSFRTDSVKRYGVNPKQKLTSEESEQYGGWVYLVMGTPCPDVYLDRRSRDGILPVLPAMRMDSGLGTRFNPKGIPSGESSPTYTPSHLLGTLYDDCHVALLVKAALEVAAPAHPLDIPAELEIQPKRTPTKQLNSLVASLRRNAPPSVRRSLKQSHRT